VTVRSTEPTATTVGPAMGRPAPSVRRILSASARHFGLTNDDLIGSSRRRTVALARGIAMYLARQFCGESLAAIGRRFSGRDHTTVMHAIRVTQERIQRDPAVAADVDAILTTLGCETNPGSQDA
jgi:chromosomal replication initiation ATPase DnaA